ncbi:ATP-binding protein [Saccharopolyspora endophytica]|uniref:histidine kinase n=1 Tax=Saccharopolyspora endophytica TaxID=543886 RepID=A0ABS5DQN8_9PSEU|nr:hypothetical protein [Saccharopolyspora endophytica]MBQ0928606.1 hypothetical protein [Saccharopolyspora endophytica]
MAHAPLRAHDSATRGPVIVLVLVSALLGLGAVICSATGFRLPVLFAVLIAALIVGAGIGTLVMLPNQARPDSPDLDAESGEHRATTSEAVPPATDEQHERPVPGEPSAEMWLPLAARLQSLLLRLVNEIDSLEHDVEDPELLHALFRADHLVIQALRLAETLEVLGGRPVHRRAREPVPLRALVRAAISEITRYTQVETTRIDDVAIVPAAHGDLRHVLAELIDNATWASDPDGEPALVRARLIPAGLKITISDHGIAPRTEDEFARCNAVLRGSIQVAQVLADGQYGLAVVGLVAQRREIHASLEPNQYGGTDAVIVVPQQWLVKPTQPSHAPPAQPSLAAEPHPQRQRNTPRHLAGELLPEQVSLPPNPPTPAAAESTLPQLPNQPPETRWAVSNQSSDSKPPLPQRVPGHHIDPLPRPEPASAPRNTFDPDAIGQVSNTLTGRSPALPSPDEAPYPFFPSRPQGTVDDFSERP